ncbi:MAG: hypothetical protein C7B43_15575 [Sulfobacillus benefaciens]|uniref:Uncharacterized protein n=1 Tax=Sulfobacillus benefaciens TaxID=453960 RepID=A0A2T2WUI7_9FIRM|nr:MAG: hypothetical protein C7B43_15575 [Sulfobacillus benefaciens]HBQ94894.1 hypothetical protein [Sulfobacillus sp.]
MDESPTTLPSFTATLISQIFAEDPYGERHGSIEKYPEAARDRTLKGARILHHPKPGRDRWTREVFHTRTGPGFSQTPVNWKFRVSRHPQQ